MRSYHYINFFNILLAFCDLQRVSYCCIRWSQASDLKGGNQFDSISLSLCDSGNLVGICGNNLAKHFIDYSIYNIKTFTNIFKINMGTCNAQTVLEKQPQLTNTLSGENRDKKSFNQTFNYQSNTIKSSNKQNINIQVRQRKSQILKDGITATFHQQNQDTYSQQYQQEELDEFTQEEQAGFEELLNVSLKSMIRQKQRQQSLVHNIDASQRELYPQPTFSKPACKKLTKRPHKIQYEDGSFYEGDVLNGLRHGQGTLLYADGNKYVGRWANNLANGYGKLYKSNNDIYQGDWLNGMAHGHGIFTTSDGKKYNGEWENDKQNGYGVEIWEDGAQYKGQYKNGLKNGNGKLSFKDGSYYDGYFQNNQIHGIGIYYWVNSRKYEGQWKHNKMNGKGRLEYMNGNIYQGDFKDDKKHGRGTFIWSDGKKYIGGWAQGKQHGIGEYWNAEGEKKIGEWMQGKRLAKY